LPAADHRTGGRRGHWWARSRPGPRRTGRSAVRSVAACPSVRAQTATHRQLNPMPAVPETRQRGALASVLFVVTFAYYWISLNPFKDLSTEIGLSAALPQVLGMALLVLLLVYVGLQSNAALLLAPKAIVITLFVWLAL